MKLRVTFSKYHPWYLCQISLQIILLPILIYCLLVTIIIIIIIIVMIHLMHYVNEPKSDKLDWITMPFYKITTIVCARSDWLRGVFAWEYVLNMVVASRCFAFRAIITQARIWNSFQVQNSTSLLYLPIPSSAETWKIVTKKVCPFFFRLSWHFKREKSVFCKASFCKTRADYACKTSWTRFCDW